MSDLIASQDVMVAVINIRAEIDRIWEDAWRFTWHAVIDGVNEEFYAAMNSNPVLASLFFEMQNTVYIWRKAGMSVDEVPPKYSVRTTKLESLFVKVEAA